MVSYQWNPSRDIFCGIGQMKVEESFGCKDLCVRLYNNFTYVNINFLFVWLLKTVKGKKRGHILYLYAIEELN